MYTLSVVRKSNIIIIYMVHLCILYLWLERVIVLLFTWSIYVYFIYGVERVIVLLFHMVYLCILYLWYRKSNIIIGYKSIYVYFIYNLDRVIVLFFTWSIYVYLIYGLERVIVLLYTWSIYILYILYSWYRKSNIIIFYTSHLCILFLLSRQYYFSLLYTGVINPTITNFIPFLNSILYQNSQNYINFTLKRKNNKRNTL